LVFLIYLGFFERLSVGVLLHLGVFGFFWLFDLILVVFEVVVLDFFDGQGVDAFVIVFTTNVGRRL